GDEEVRRFMRHFGLSTDRLATSTLLEIGSGIGRMTAAFTNLCARVIATDVDAAFLERCHQTIALHGRPERLSTVHVADGRTLAVQTDSVDHVFSYIVLQHCQHDDALALTSEAIRVTRSGGTIMLNYRTWVPLDVVLIPLGVLVRLLWRLPLVGKQLSTKRWATRFGWQANRLSPDEVLDHLSQRGELKYLTDVRVLHSHRRQRSVRHAGVSVGILKRTNRSHWWLVAQVSK
ncbi:MAG: class I SAM-dependent methyltransferase, partial [Actinobacteria bacterium]|nr:class I SAM-dependent methyltransferase [Actinomycetota bacterium]